MKRNSLICTSKKRASQSLTSIISQLELNNNLEYRKSQEAAEQLRKYHQRIFKKLRIRLIIQISFLLLLSLRNVILTIIQKQNHQEVYDQKQQKVDNNYLKIK
ncbi:hypothetical protein ABPG72_018756 [Tetrahymena utriculariae]